MNSGAFWMEQRKNLFGSASTSTELKDSVESSRLIGCTLAFDTNVIGCDDVEAIMVDYTTDFIQEFRSCVTQSDSDIDEEDSERMK